MLVVRLAVRDFRCLAQVDVALGPGVTVVHGANASGKTSLMEALYFGCTSRPYRPGAERELVRLGADHTRVVVGCNGEDGDHEIAVGMQAGERKRITVDGAAVERLSASPARPLVAVFLPSRIELLTGPPALRRAHVDQLVAGLWPGRTGTRRAYVHALAQRNALLARVRLGRTGADALDAWDHELARHGVALRDDRAQAIAVVAASTHGLAGELGVAGEVVVEYRPRSQAPDAETLVRELGERRARDVERGFTGHGPHRDDVTLVRDGRELRAFGSQGERRLAVLALLLAEREAVASSRDRRPLMVLDDVMSELDAARREYLVTHLLGPGQSVITTTELAHVPGAHADGVARLELQDGAVVGEAVAA